MFIRKIKLNLFDGAAAASGAGGEGAASQGDSNTPGTTRQGKSGEYANVKFGKQDSSAEGNVTNAAEANNPAAGDNPEVKTTSNTLEDKRKAFHDLIQGEYKDQYTEATQRIIDRRFGATKQLEAQVAQMNGVMAAVAEKYGLQANDFSGIQKALDNDNSFWADKAEEVGMTVEQYKEYSRMKQENEAFKAVQQQAQNRQAANMKVQQWISEGQALKAKFPDFDLQKETQNPQFMNMLKSGVPVEHAYKVIHYDEMMNGVAQTVASNTEKAVVQNVRARGNRPNENGTAGQSAFTVKDDVSKLSKKDRAEIAKRVARGEKISF